MADILEPQNADKRTWERYVRQGLLDEKAYEKHVKSLPDVAEKGASISTVMEEDQFDDQFDSETDADDEAEAFSEDIPQV